MTGDPDKEYGTNKPPPTGRVQERSKSDTTCPTASQNPPLWQPSWLNKACTTRKDSESEWLAKDNWETNPITIKPETESHVTEQLSWVPLPYCSPPGCPFPNKISCFVSTCVSLDSSFLSVRQEPSFCCKGSPFLQQNHRSDWIMTIKRQQSLARISWNLPFKSLLIWLEIPLSRKPW